MPVSIIYRSSLVLLCVVLFLSSCKREETAPELIADRTGCSFCKMLVSETAFAAAYSQNKQQFIFDDIGCMLSKIESDPAFSPSHVWVRDLLTDTWIDGNGAYFVHAKKLETPMGFGYVAYRDKTAADKKKQEISGTLLHGIDELVSYHKAQ